MKTSSISPAWKTAHELLRRAAAAPAGSGERNRAVAVARRHFESGGDERLAKLARLLVPGMDDAALLTALVPVERVASRAYVSDADLGITTEDVPGPRPAPLRMIAVADNLRSAFNIGGLFRSADAVGLEAVWLCGYSATPEHPAVRRAALGADESVPWRVFGNVREAIEKLRAEGRAVYALETVRNAVPVQRFAFRFPSALLLGSERFGLDPEVVRSADAVLRLETFGAKNSLNVVCAFTAAAYAARWSVKEAALAPCGEGPAIVD